MAENVQKSTALDDILAMSAQVNRQENPVNITNYMLNRNQAPSANPSIGGQIHNLRVDRLTPFHAHPFKLYEGQRFKDLAGSIKANGIMLPIIVRPVNGGNYEILSGHNRVNAAKAAGLSTVPAIVREGLADEDALLIVTETNLLQRSFADLSHSERALALSTHYDAIKHQGRRVDLINDIENMLKASDDAISEPCAPVAHKINSREVLGEKYGLGHDSVARYIRINKLIDGFKERVDNNEISIRAGVSLSYLPESQQEIVEDILGGGSCRIDMAKAEALRAASEKNALTYESAEGILKSTKKRKPAYSNGFKIPAKILSKYFKPDQKRTEVEAMIAKALEYYFSNQTGLAADTAENFADVESQ